MACLHPSKVHVTKKKQKTKVSYDRPLVKKCMRYLPLKNKFLRENHFFHGENNFSTGYLEFHIGKKNFLYEF